MTPPTIRSRSNPRYRACLQLRTRRARKRSGEFLIDGPRDCLRAILAGIAPQRIFVRDDLDLSVIDHSSDLGGVIRWAQANDVLLRVEPSLFPALCYGQRDSQVVAVAAAVDTPLEKLTISQTPLIVILDSIEKPGNVGAIFRTADAVAADAVILTGSGTDRFNPNTIRSSAGTVFSVPTAYADFDSLKCWLSERNVAVALARVDGQQAYWNLSLIQAVAIVFGNEAKGLGPHWQALPHDTFQIPMAGIADSLNVSVSAAVMLFEARRQRFNA